MNIIYIDLFVNLLVWGMIGDMYEKATQHKEELKIVIRMWKLNRLKTNVYTGWLWKCHPIKSISKVFCIVKSYFCNTYSTLNKVRFGAKWLNKEWIICKSEFPLILFERISFRYESLGIGFLHRECTKIFLKVEKIYFKMF